MFATPEKRLHHLITFFFIVGFVLTLLSWLQACTSACVEVHFYKYFGIDFEILGFAFYIVAGVLHVLSLRFRQLGYIVGLLLAGAVGSEINFIFVQKYVIEQWCPLCLTIAAVIGILSLLYLTNFFYRLFYADQPLTWGKVMKAMFKSAGIILVAIIAYGIAFVGVFKPEKSFAEGLNNEEVPFFGNPDSQVEVYVITDWFCPACRQVEPKITPYYNRIMAKARLFFVDYPIHPETMNYVPYNLSFMLKNKKDYVKIRKALHRLSKKTKTPSPQDINEAVELYEVKYTPLNFADINEGIKFQEGIVKTFKVKATPTVVVANRKKLKAKKLSGANITGENIMKAINDVQNN